MNNKTFSLGGIAIIDKGDKAEKFIRNLKEGIELHPVRHWTKYCIIAYSSFHSSRIF
ncbi:MAG: hypothetical protein J7J36_06285 [Thermoplasmata archaeon]|nr:hypothetical protein [Thermoplasmata archaeon]